MEIQQNETKLHFEVVDSEDQTISSYSIENGDGMLLNFQVSGEIQAYDEVEVGLYTSENAPLCGFGSFVITRIPISKFLMTMGMVSAGIYHPKYQSKFAHVSFWTEDNSAKQVELDLKETLNYWESQFPEQKNLIIKMMLSGVSGSGSKTFIRDIDLITLIK
jgi:hypothetical protein